MPFETDGFFAAEMSQWIQMHRAEQPAWFDLALRFNRYAHRVCNQLEIRSSDAQQMLCVSLLMRSLEHFQGMFIMLDRGMISAARVLLRCQVEAIFSLCAIERKPDEVVGPFVLADWIVQRKALNKIKLNIVKGDGGEFSEEERAGLEARLNECSAEIEDKDISEVKVWWLAKQADMMATYNAVYPYLSGSVHSNSRDLDRYIQTNANGDATGLLWGPQTEGTVMCLSIGIEMLSFALRAIERLFKVDTHESLHMEFVTLAQALQTSRQPANQDSVGPAPDASPGSGPDASGDGQGRGAPQ
jgi:hypothetical protein